MNENFMRKATFVACLIAAVMCVVFAVANWKIYQSRMKLFAWMEQLQQGVVQLERGKELDMRQYMQQSPLQEKPKTKE